MPTSKSLLSIPLILFGICAGAHENDCWRDLLPVGINYEANLLAERFERFDIHAPSNIAFVLVPRLGSGHPRHVNLKAEPTTLIRYDRWHMAGEFYRVFDVGQKSLEAAARQVYSVIAHHLLRYPFSPLTIEFDPTFRATRERATDLRWRFHEAVLKKYFAKKKYLSAHDRRLLELPNTDSNNNDVFGVLQDRGHWEHLSQEDVANNLLVSLQISYFGSRDFLSPNYLEFLRTLGKRFERPALNLPFEYRLDPRRRAAFTRKVWAEFDPVHTCEITRYASFRKGIPRSVNDKLLQTALTTAARRGMRVLLASADSKTERLFTRYGFKRYAPLPVHHDEEPEFLLYMRMPSPEYDDLKIKLAKSVSGAVRTHEQQD